ncbi:MAG TPA: c-type cytochrome biogenesis protein CcsB [Syntrophorhabdaceae bacterium]|nr:c-type cytochrome biogenesis protein CcsB [Syntrophorhabdaceae bacterium]
MNRFFFYCALVSYLISTGFYLIYLIKNKDYYEKAGHYLFIVGFFAHLVTTVIRYLEAGYTPITNLYESLSFFSLCIAGFFLYLKGVYKTGIIGAIILPVISIILIWASTFPWEIKPLPPVLNSYWLPIHTIFCFAGNGIFLISFFVSILYLILEYGIKRKKIPSVLKRLPSLEVLDTINYRCISYGFPFLTVGIITGSLWASIAWGSYWSWDPKETWSLITWIFYAIILHNRLAMGWRGKKTAYMMIIGFFSILFTFLGVNFLIGGLHSYV